ncbi:MAG: hypothetical protein LBS53_01240 [Synergistaceae bacterium]|nr:hypothetical protein [Synergistaceae bacterium]
MNASNPFILLALGILAFLGAVVLVACGKKTLFRNTFILFVIAFLGGMSFYSTLYFSGELTSSGVLYAVFRGLFSTARMFAFADDYSFFAGVPSAEWLTNNAFLFLLFWLFHCIAALVSVLTILSIFGRKLTEQIRIRFRRYSCAYIICGVSPNSLALARNIATHDGALISPDPKRLIVFLDKFISDEMLNSVEEVGGAAFDYSAVSFSSRLVLAGLGASPKRIASIKIIFMRTDYENVMSLFSESVECAESRAVAKNRLDIYVQTDSCLSNQDIFDFSSRKRAFGLHKFSETELAARSLLSLRPPWACLSFEKGVAVKNFSMMILGFGSFGEELLCRFIMNGQFVGSRARAIVIDSKMDRLKEPFKRKRPSIEMCCDLDFINADVGSETFYNYLDETVFGIDYIIIALGETGPNLNTAQNLLEFFRRADKKIPVIAVRFPEGEGEEKNNNVLFFSKRDKIFSETLVIHEDSDRMASAVNYAYNFSVNGQAPEKTREELWDELSDFNKESSRATADFIPAMLAIAGLDEKQAIERERLTDDDSVAELLAHTEHIRWNAFHCVMGYTPMSLEMMKARFDKSASASCLKDADKKRHGCLVEYDSLDKVSDFFNKLMDSKALPRRDFKREDRFISKNIPKILKSKKDDR